MNDSLLRDLQLLENEMLKAVASICKKHGIQYYLISGTLLGAVRHHGFIPWDDDIDIVMFHSDYLRFLKVAQGELGAQYFVQTSETDPAWYRAYATIRKNGTTMSDVPKLTHSSMHQGIWLDIFPLAWMKNKREVRFKHRLIQIANYLAMDEFLNFNIEEIRDMFGRFWPLIRFIYRIPEKTRKKWRSQITSFIFGKKTHGKYAVSIWAGITPSTTFPAACFDGPPSTVEFEGNDYDAPHDIDLALTTNYGANYMTPVKPSYSTDYMVIDLNKDYLDYKKEYNKN